MACAAFCAASAAATSAAFAFAEAAFSAAAFALAACAGVGRAEGGLRPAHTPKEGEGTHGAAELWGEGGGGRGRAPPTCSPR